MSRATLLSKVREAWIRKENIPAEKKNRQKALKAILIEFRCLYNAVTYGEDPTGNFLEFV